jgi:putative endonuclease
VKRKALGDWGEKVAREYLLDHGYHIIETNYRCREGEIDIVARDKEYLVFVEVRTRRGCNFGSPEESVTNTKKKKLISLAFNYLQNHNNLPSLWRFDVVAIESDGRGKVIRLELIQNAIN